MRLVLLIFVLTQSVLADKSLNPFIKQFVTGVINKDKSAITNIIKTTKNAKILWTYEGLDNVKRVDFLKRLTNTDIIWPKVGDTIRLFQGDFTVEKSMVNDKTKIAVLKLPSYGIPIKIHLIGKRKLIDPHWMIRVFDYKNKKFARDNLAPYKIIIDGKEFEIKLEEKMKIVTKDGKQHEITLFKNDIQRAVLNDLSFDYYYSLNLIQEKKPFGQITRLENTKDSLIAVVYNFNKDVDTATVYENAAESVNSFRRKETGTMFSDEEKSINVFNKFHTGVAFKSVTEGVTFITEFYVIKNNNRHSVLIFYYNIEDSISSKKHINLICNTLKYKK